MRGWVLLLLGAGLGYFGWRQLSGEPAAGGPEGEASVQAAPGRLRPASELLEGSRAAEPQAESLPDSGAAAPQPPPTSPAPAPARAAGPGDDLDVTWTFGDPVEQGRRIAHGTESVPSYLERQTDLSRSRRALVFAYACVVKGLAQQAAEYLPVLEQATDVSLAELEHLRRGIEGRRIDPGELRTLFDRPVLLGLGIGRLAQQAASDQRAGRYPEAARSWSALLRAELDAPWEAERPALRAWSETLAQAQAHHRWNRRGEWPSFEVEVQRGDSLVAIRKRIVEQRPGLNLCTGLIDRANQIGGRDLHPGQSLRIPTEPVHTMVYLKAFFVLYLHGEEVVAAWEVATGRDGSTVPGHYVVGNKITEPPWTRVGHPIVPYGSPDNPLGTRWIAWQGSNGLGFHGTREPQTIGSAASDGCIRMRNEAVEELFEILPMGAEILVRL